MTGKLQILALDLFLVDVSDFSFWSGEGKGESEAPGRGDRSFFVFFFENSIRGAGLQEGDGAEAPGGCLLRIGDFLGGGGGG